MKILEGGLVHMLLAQLLALNQSSNAELYRQAVGLGIIKEGELALKSFHYHVRNLGLRQESVSHVKRAGVRNGKLPPSLASCRLFSSPRLSFSVRLIPFAYDSEVGAGASVVYGALGVVQELCSGMLRAKVLGSGAASPNDLCGLELAALAEFVGAAISLPKLKIEAIHFPNVRYHSSPKAGPEGLIAAWLGYAQPLNRAVRLQQEFSKFRKACLDAADWGGDAHRLRLQLDAFHMDFPDQTESAMLNLSRPRGKPWQLRTVTKEINARVDRWNLGLRTDEDGPLADELSPVLRIWIARQCFRRVSMFNEERQRDALRGLCKSIMYRKRLHAAALARIQDFGIEHLDRNDYPIYR